MWMKVLGEFAKRFLKNKGKQAASNGNNIIRVILIAVLVFFFFIVFPILIIISVVSAFFCGSLLGGITEAVTLGKVSCPKPPIDVDAVEDLSEEMYKLRKKVYDGLKNKGDAEIFRTKEEAGVKTDDPDVYDQAETWIRVMAGIDLNTLSLYGIGDKDFVKGGRLEKTTFASNYKYARELFDGKLINFFKFKENEEKDFRKNFTHYFMNYRLVVYRCFLIGEDCDEDGIKESMGTDKYINVVGDKKGDSFKYPKTAEILDKFYEISLLKSLDGDKGSGKDSKKEFNKWKELYLKKFSEKYPAYPSTSSPMGVMGTDWLVPMIPSTWNFADGYGNRMLGGKPEFHKGIDMGVAGVTGVPIFAAKGGTVVSSGVNNGGYGGIVLIDHGSGFFSMYAHMHADDIVVRKGQQVSQGQLIGAAGNQPAVPYHLHFEICTSVAEGSGADLTGGALTICGERVNPEDPQFKMSFRTPQDVGKTNNHANEFKSSWKAKAKGGEVIIMPGFTPMSANLGALAEKYESSGDPGMCVHHASDPGGMSCGSYQVPQNTGTMDDFMKFLGQHYPQYYEKLHSVPRVIGSFGPAWRALYESDKNGFFQAQYQFQYETHYNSVREAAISKFGFDPNTRSNAVQQMWWSISTQHRYNVTHDLGGKTALFKEALGGVDGWRSMSDADIITKIYDRRYERWSCCRPRFKSEKQDALNLLAAEGKK
ncbi:M23 family metallopeptidase [Bacillus sp. Brlt_9]|uniref:M23 family metallopeptidase n=1 Tax=Bacillus sp. Brlt_9 TaxID=3110916 RepID=UPI003F7B479D